jgi:hypothetical protein
LEAEKGCDQQLFLTLPAAAKYLEKLQKTVAAKGAVRSLSAPSRRGMRLKALSIDSVSMIGADEHRLPAERTSLP